LYFNRIFNFKLKLYGIKTFRFVFLENVYLKNNELFDVLFEN